MKRYLLALLLPLFASASSEVKVNQCIDYVVTAAEKGCSQDNFLVKFAYHYCQEYEKELHWYSYEGQQILNDIKSCLLEKTKSDSQLTCENSKQRALDDHVDCYVSRGFCKMQFFERLNVYDTMFSELLDPDFFRTGLKIRSQCRFILFSNL